VKKTFGKDYEGGARRTRFAEAAEVEEVPLEAMIDREPVTVVCSQMGWIRAMKGHIALDTRAEVQGWRRAALHLPCRDHRPAAGLRLERAVLHALGVQPARRARHGRAAAADGRSAQRGRDRRALHPPAGRKLLVASSAGDGFVVPEDEVVAQTRAGKQVLNVRAPAKAKVCKPVAGDHVAVVGENRKVLVFPLDELPEMTRGKGVRLQKYKDGGLSDATTFTLAEGLSWLDPAGRTRTEADLAEWMGKRASAGRMAPRGFPRDNRFT
jgi:topoisomerase-4 subunit A